MSEQDKAAAKAARDKLHKTSPPVSQQSNMSTLVERATGLCASGQQADRSRDRSRCGASVGALVASGKEAVRCMESQGATAELDYVLSEARKHPVLACILARLSVGETIVGADGKENTNTLQRSREC